MHAIKLIALFIVAQIAIYLGQTYGPSSSLPSIVEVNEHYLAVVQRHVAVLGLCAGAAVGLANFVTRLRLHNLVLVVVIAGILQHVWYLSAEPDFTDYLAGELFDFLTVYLPMSAVPLAVLWLAQRQRNAAGNTEAT